MHSITEEGAWRTVQNSCCWRRWVQW